MTVRYVALPLSSPLESTDARADESRTLPDEMEIVDDVHGDLEPDGVGDAASADEVPMGPPSRSALHWHRVKEALRHFQAVETGAPEIRAMNWRNVIEVKAPGAPMERANAASESIEEARLGERDARGEANKPTLDRPGEAKGVVRPRHPALAFGDAEPHRKTTRPPLPSWASLAIDSADPSCTCKCRGRWALSSKEQLIDAILREGASRIPVRLLRENFTKLGLRALLCGALCGRVDELMGGEPTRNPPPARGGRAPRVQRP